MGSLDQAVCMSGSDETVGIGVGMTCIAEQRNAPVASCTTFG
jgi:hypothetical protein